MRKNKRKMTKKQLKLNKLLIANMINKIDSISNYCKDEMLIIRLAKFQQQLFKLNAAEEVYVTDIDYKINDVIDDILKIVMKEKDSASLERLLNNSVSQLIDLMETRITIDHLND